MYTKTSTSKSIQRLALDKSDFKTDGLAPALIERQMIINFIIKHLLLNNVLSVNLINQAKTTSKLYKNYSGTLSGITQVKET